MGIQPLLTRPESAGSTRQFFGLACDLTDTMGRSLDCWYIEVQLGVVGHSMRSAYFERHQPLRFR